MGIALAANDSVCRDAAHMCCDFCNEGLMQLANAAAAVAVEERVVHVESSSFASASNNLVQCAPSQEESSASSLAKKPPVLPEFGHGGVFALLKEAGIAPSTVTVAGQAVGVEFIRSVAIKEITEEDAEDNLPLSKRRNSSQVGKKKKALEIAPFPARSAMDWLTSSAEAPAMQPQESAEPVENLSNTNSKKDPEVAKRLNKTSVLPADLETSRSLATKDLFKLIDINSTLLRSNFMDLLERAEQQDDLLHPGNSQKLNKAKLAKITELETEMEKLKQEIKSEKEKSNLALGQGNSEVDQCKEKVVEMELSMAKKILKTKV